MQSTAHMRQLIKYCSLSLVILLFLFTITVMLLPTLIDVQQYVPGIEKKISKITGRQFLLGQDLKVSIFPRLTVSCSNISLGNSPGFGEGRFLTIDSFEAGLRLMPLLKHQLKVSRFTIQGLELNLEKRADGRGNWYYGGSTGESEGAVPGLPSGTVALLMEELAVPLINITESRVTWRDSILQDRHEITDVELNFHDLTMNSSFATDFKGVVDGRPVRLEGRAGPLAGFFRQGILKADLKFNLFDNMSGLLKGQFEDSAEGLGYDFDLEITPFSPKIAWADVAGDVSIITAYPRALNTLAVKSRIRGTTDSIVFEDGVAELDDSRIDFSCSIQGFAEPDIKFSVKADNIDLSRYLRQHKKGSLEEGGENEGSGPGSGYSLFQRSGIEGTIRAGEVQFHGGKFSDVKIKLVGKNGRYTADPVIFSFYRGQVESKITFNIGQVRPAGFLELHAEDVVVSPMLRDLFKIDLLRGRLNSDITLSISGDSTVSMVESLNGEGDLRLSDGMLLGYELISAGGGSHSGMTDSGAVKAEKHIDFSEFKGSVTVKDGIVEVRRAELHAPAARLLIEGMVDLAAVRLDLQISSNNKIFIRGKGSSGHYVMPFALRGTFSDLQLDSGTGRRAAADGQRVLVEDIDVRKLVDDTIPVPVDDYGKDLVGKTLVDPAVVALRFGLGPATISKTKVKKKFRVGSGKIQISPLRKGLFLPLE